jgi:hypothetical protein
LNTASSSVILSDGTKVKFSSGNGKISSNCTTTGSLLTTVGVRFSLVDGHMDKGKTVISGVYKRSDGDLGLVNFVR